MSSISPKSPDAHHELTSYDQIKLIRGLHRRGIIPSPDLHTETFWIPQTDKTLSVETNNGPILTWGILTPFEFDRSATLEPGYTGPSLLRESVVLMLHDYRGLNWLDYRNRHTGQPIGIDFILHQPDETLLGEGNSFFVYRIGHRAMTRGHLVPEEVTAEVVGDLTGGFIRLLEGAPAQELVVSTED